MLSAENQLFVSSTTNAINPVTNTEDLDFSRLDQADLICPINVDEIATRWVNSYISVPGQPIKDYHPRISDFIYRILKSYASISVRSREVPPFIHPSQKTRLSSNPSLPTCMSIVRMCEKPLPGSEGVAAEILTQEMSKIYERHSTYDDMGLLETFQAYLIYTMVLFFRLNQGPSPFLRQAMLNLQELACSTSRQGLMCLAEQQRARPKWEAWIVTEAKRRTLFVMYLLDNVLSSQEGLPTFLGTELRGLLAPTSKSLWEARTRRDWEMKYNVYLAEWPEGGLCIDELWSMPSDFDDFSIAERRSRVDQWLEDLDEFGMMIYTVTSCTHGG
ncbi:putative C6 finger-containing protein [Coleophoma crateriformis]|uniref:Putative C6 finger-containing protein n=1 Tax=Coleophoma crateriformis TaxID=565419 RepID=A0A3D8RVB9_9HELO|nr:putative C6 finger-containing protein [Coleophoma crateriformis]